MFAPPPSKFLAKSHTKDAWKLHAALRTVFENHCSTGNSNTSSAIDGGAEVPAAPPGRLNVKMGPLLACFSVFSVLLIFSRILLLAFFKNFSECFPVISGVSSGESS